ncbi:MAG TPA: DUF4416 family protein [Thermodesulfovibrionales bacterium]|nr:DUF4416 family protein [Thermodesulfovibrionales bacterium]
MGSPSNPDPALLFIGTLYRSEAYLSEARQKLRASFGEVALESRARPWDHSEYYKEELGSPLSRTFIFFRDMINPEALGDIKLFTNRVELQLSSHGKRNINLDPGYLTPYQVVLASTKNYAHRIYLGKGIYAEVTLVHKDGRYCSHLFTYRDYASDEYIQLFEHARVFLKEQQR